MIKVGILGAATPLAGEIIRILVHHPEVELRTLHAPSLAGHPATSAHHGLWGEETLLFTEKADFPHLDVAIICEPSDVAKAAIEACGSNPEMRLIDLTGRYGPFEFGLSEINRKPLVRGARRASVPAPLAAVALIALYPFAAALMLNNDIAVTAEGSLGTSQPADDASTIEKRLAAVQNSFSSRVIIDDRSTGTDRGMRLRISFPSTLTVADACRLYDGIYDDHNFTFLTPRPVELKEVEGTQKCLVNVSKPDAGSILLDVVADPTMRGGAGEAVHLLNLLFGLHERTGLDLKVSTF